MKRKSSIVKLAVMGALIVLGFVLAFTPINLGLTTYSGFANEIKLGLDLKGGVYAVYEAEAIAGSNEDFGSAMDGTITSLTQILNDKGYDATLQKEGGNKIRVSVPNVDDPRDILKILGSPAEIVFRMNETGEEVLTGKHVSKAGSDLVNGDHVVVLSLTSEGAARFAQYTAANTGKKMDIVMISGGDEEIISSPEISTAITGGQAIISGMGTADQAQQLAQQITAGQFSLRLTQKEVSTVSATLGESALKYGLIAGGIGLLLTIALLLWRYRLFGMVSALVLLAYTVLILFILSVFPWVQLTLPGIAGIILSIGMAVDGSIIINERIREEYRIGKSILSSSHYGFRKSVSAILDSNITTVISSIVLFIFGTGSVKGFALTLLIGIIIAMFATLVILRWLLRVVVRLSDHNPRLYNLHRGEGFESLSADRNDAATEREIADEQRKKAERRNAEKAEKASEGGVI